MYTSNHVTMIGTAVEHNARDEHDMRCDMQFDIRETDNMVIISLAMGKTGSAYHGVSY